MSLIKCPKCGEMFSDSYKTCPFCQEDEEYYDIKHSGRSSGGRSGGGRRVIEGHSTGPKILGPALIVVVLLLAAVLAYAFFGDAITAALKGGEQEPQEPVVQEIDVSVTPASATLTEGEVLALHASGAGKYVWSSSDENVVTVDETGTLTAVAAGTAVITVSDGQQKSSAQCAVTVEKPDAADPNGGTDGGNSTGEDPAPVNVSDKLTFRTIFGPVSKRDDGKFDLTMKTTDSFALQLEGASGTVQWSTNKSSVVTVDSDGTLHPVAEGEAEVTATVGGQSAVCIVRVKW